MRQRDAIVPFLAARAVHATARRPRYFCLVARAARVSARCPGAFGGGENHGATADNHDEICGNDDNAEKEDSDESYEYMDGGSDVDNEVDKDNDVLTCFTRPSIIGSAY